MADTIQLTLDPTQLRLKPGQGGQTVLTIRNRSVKPQACLITVEGPGTIRTTLSSDQAALFRGDRYSIEVTVKPAERAPGGPASVLLRVQDQDSGDESTIALNIEVDAPLAATSADGSSTEPVQTERPPLEALLPTASVTPAATTTPSTAAQATPSTTSSSSPRPEVIANAGGVIRVKLEAEEVAADNLPLHGRCWQLSLKNTGERVTDFVFRVEDIPPGWFQVEPRLIELKVDETKTARLTVTPPESTPRGQYPFRLVAFAMISPTSSDAVNLGVTIPSIAAYRLEASPSDKERTGDGSVKFKLLLVSEAHTNVDLDLKLTATDANHALSYIFTPDTIRLPMRKQLPVTLEVRPLRLATQGQRLDHKITVTAQRVDRPDLVQTEEVKYTQLPPPPISLELKPEVNSGTTEAIYTLSITNSAQTELPRLTFRASDPEDGCTYLFKPESIVPRGASRETVEVIVKTKAYLETGPEKEFPFQVRALPEGELTPIGIAKGIFRQRSAPPVRLTLEPERQRAVKTARYDLRVQNMREETLHLWLKARDNDDGLGFNFDPPDLTLPKRATSVTRLTVSSRDNVRPGERPLVRPFVVECEVEKSSAPVTVNGSLTQIPDPWKTVFKRAWWVIRWALTLLAVVVVGLIALGVMNQAVNQDRNGLGRLFTNIIVDPRVRWILSQSWASPANQVANWLYNMIRILRGL